MMLDDVPADDVHDLAVAFPDLLPVEVVVALGILLRTRDVLDRRVDPDVEDEILPVLAGVVDPPVHVTRDTPVLEAVFDPLAGLVARVRGPLEVV